MWDGLEVGDGKAQKNNHMNILWRVGGSYGKAEFTVVQLLEIAASVRNRIEGFFANCKEGKT